jgi:hypothetical protein
LNLGIGSEESEAKEQLEWWITQKDIKTKLSFSQSVLKTILAASGNLTLVVLSEWGCTTLLGNLLYFCLA